MYREPTQIISCRTLTPLEVMENIIVMMMRGKARKLEESEVKVGKFGSTRKIRKRARKKQTRTMTLFS